MLLGDEMVYSVSRVMQAIQSKDCLARMDDVIHAFNPDGDSIDKLLYILEKTLTEAQGGAFKMTWKQWQEENPPVYDTILSDD